MSGANKQVLEAANAAIAAGDVEGFLRHCMDDTVWTFVGDRTLRGKEMVREWLKATYREPPRNDVERLVTEGDVVVAIGTIAVKDDAGNWPRQDYCDVWLLREGRLSELRAFVV